MLELIAFAIRQFSPLFQHVIGLFVALRSAVRFSGIDESQISSLYTWGPACIAAVH